MLKVSVLVLIAGFGLKMAKTPGGGFSTYKKTMLLKPPSGVILIVVVPTEPCATVRLLGDAESKKSGCEDGAGAFTVRLMVVVRVKPLDVPVTVTVAVPKAAGLLAVNVKVLEVVAGF